MFISKCVFRTLSIALLLIAAGCGASVNPPANAPRVPQVIGNCTTNCYGTPAPSPAPTVPSCQTQMNCQNVGCNGDVGSDVCGTNVGCLGMDDGEECLDPGQCDVTTNECNEPGTVACINPFGCAANDFNGNAADSGKQSVFHRTSSHYLYQNYIYFNVYHFWSQHFACNFSSSQSTVLDAIANDMNTNQQAFLKQSNSVFFASTTAQFSFTDPKAGTVTIQYSASTGLLFGGDSLVTTAYPVGPNVKSQC